MRAVRLVRQLPGPAGRHPVPRHLRPRLCRIDPIAFEGCFVAWVQAILPRPAGEVVAIDGKVARRSHDRGADRPPIDLVGAWATASRLILGQLAVADHSNEIPAVPALLDVAGGVVTLDAMHGQTEAAHAIRTAGADDVLARTGNQPLTHDAVEHDAVETFFAEAVRAQWRGVPVAHLVIEDAGHGRRETRRYWTTTAADLSRISTRMATPGQTWAGSGWCGASGRSTGTPVARPATT